MDHETLKLFTLNALIFTAASAAILKVAPEGPIISKPGDIVKINCSIEETDKSSSDESEEIVTGKYHLRWKLDRHMSSVDEDSNRFVTTLLSPSVIQLTISPVLSGDAGVYTCKNQVNYDDITVRLYVAPPSSNASVCSTTQMRCGDGKCIFLRYRCDKVPDCLEADAADEKDCDAEFDCTDKWRCDSGQCVDPRHVCDDMLIYHCRDRSDEKYCGRNNHYTGQVRPAVPADGSVTPAGDPGAAGHGLHFSAVYSGVASIVGLVLIAAIVIVTVCRIHMRREAQRHMLAMESRQQSRRQRVRQRLPWQQTTGPGCEPPSVADYVSPRGQGPHSPGGPLVAPNVEVNINLSLSPAQLRQLTAAQHPQHRMSQLVASPEGVSLLLSPPPYSPPKPEAVPREGTPPPPYCTIDNRTRGSGGDDAADDSSPSADTDLVSPVTLLTTPGSAGPADFSPSDLYAAPSRASLPPYEERDTALMDQHPRRRADDATSLTPPGAASSVRDSATADNAGLGGRSSASHDNTEDSAVSGIRLGERGDGDSSALLPQQQGEEVVGRREETEGARAPLLGEEEVEVDSYDADTLPVTHRGGVPRNTHC